MPSVTPPGMGRRAAWVRCRFFFGVLRAGSRSWPGWDSQGSGPLDRGAERQSGLGPVRQRGRLGLGHRDGGAGVLVPPRPMSPMTQSRCAAAMTKGSLSEHLGVVTGHEAHRRRVENAGDRTVAEILLVTSSRRSLTSVGRSELLAPGIRGVYITASFLPSGRVSAMADRSFRVSDAHPRRPAANCQSGAPAYRNTVDSKVQLLRLSIGSSL